MPAFGKRIVFFALLLCAAFALSAASAAAGLSASGGLAVYSVSGESYLRASDGSADGLGRDAAARLIELIEHPKTALIDRYVVSGELMEGGSVADLTHR